MIALLMVSRQFCLGTFTVHPYCPGEDRQGCMIMGWKLSSTAALQDRELGAGKMLPRWNWNMSKCVGSFQYQFKCCPHKYCSENIRMEVAITTSMATCWRSWRPLLASVHFS